MTTIVEEAGIAFEYDFEYDGDERGPALAPFLVGHELVDACEFEKVTGQFATEENVRAYVMAHEDGMGEVALEQHQRDSEADYDDSDAEDFSAWDDIA